jgi:phage baseplate assembly protein W
MTIVNVQKIARKIDYVDLDLDFSVHPVTGDIAKKVGVEAIARSVRNLIFYNFYDKPFQPQLGSNAQKLLFDNITLMTANMLRDAIIQVIENFEPRAEVIDVFVQSQPDENGYSAKIAFKPINRTEPYTISIFLERIR